MSKPEQEITMKCIINYFKLSTLEIFVVICNNNTISENYLILMIYNVYKIVFSNSLLKTF